jgi:hypothetical protein
MIICTGGTMKTWFQRTIGSRLAGMVMLLAICSLAPAATWNGSVDTDWFKDNNWTPAGIPLDGTNVVIGTGKIVVISNQTALLDSLDLTGTLVFTNWTTVLNATNVTIQSGGIMKNTGPFRDTEMSNQVHIVCSNLDIKTGGKIDVSAIGYLGGESNAVVVHVNGYGPGGGKSDNTQLRAGGGGYGGAGGRGASATAFGGPTYGTNSPPIFPGSGGGCRTQGGLGAGGAGGGLVQIEASGTVTVNGQIIATGGTGGGDSYGGGSGGGIYINCRTFANAGGSLTANGGQGGPNSGGSGGGGRIAVLYTNFYNLSYPFQVNPGLLMPSAQTAAQTGTIYMAYSGSDGLLTVTGTPSRVGNPVPQPYGITSIPVGTEVTNTVTSPVIIGTVGYECGGWTVTSNATIIASGSTTQAVFQMTYTNLNLTWVWNSIYYLTVTAAPSGTVASVDGWYSAGDTVQISASGQNGFTFYQWMGDVPLGQDTNNPATITMDQGRIIIAAFDSPILTTRTWASGTGNWTNWNNWSPKAIPAGTNSRAVISGGTVTLSDPLRLSSLTITNASLIFSNGTDAATLQVDGNLDLFGTTAKFYGYAGYSNAPARDWGALVNVGGTMTVMSNCWVYPYSHPAQGGSLLFRMAKLTTIGGINGGFDATSKGFSGGNLVHKDGFGPGGGTGGYGVIYIRGGGGGHGGKGGDGSGSMAGGVTNDVRETPIFPGSGGGTKTDGTAGGRGGGVVRMEVTGTATLNGALLTDGAAGTADSSGAGAGGAISVTCKTLDGNSAVLTANGGNGSLYGGGGGGGRIAIWYTRLTANTNLWSLSVTNGTAGTQNSSTGGVGTIYWKYTPHANGAIITVR